MYVCNFSKTTINSSLLSVSIVLSFINWNMSILSLSLSILKHRLCSKLLPHLVHTFHNAPIEKYRWEGAPLSYTLTDACLLWVTRSYATFQLSYRPYDEILVSTSYLLFSLEYITKIWKFSNNLLVRNETKNKDGSTSILYVTIYFNCR